MGFGQNLQRLRLAAELSQAGLAEKTGIPVKTIQSWEISRRTPRWIALLARLARGLNVPMESLAEDLSADQPEAETGEGKTKGRKSRPRKGK